MKAWKTILGMVLAGAVSAGTVLAAEGKAGEGRVRACPKADVTANADGSKTARYSRTITLPNGKTATVTVERTVTRDDQGGCTTRGTRTVATSDGKEGKGAFEGSLRKAGDGWEWKRSDSGAMPSGEAYSAETQGRLAGDSFTNKTVWKSGTRSHTVESLGKVTTDADGRRKVAGKSTITDENGKTETRDFERELGEHGLHGLLGADHEGLGLRNLGKEGAAEGRGVKPSVGKRPQRKGRSSASREL